MDQEIAAADARLIGGEAKELARSAMAANYWIATDVRCVYLRPGESITTHVRGLYLEALTPPAAKETTKSHAIHTLCERMPSSHLATVSRVERERLASSFVGLLGSRHVEFFELIDQDGSHPHAGFTYWTAWILALDQQLGRSVALAIGASD